MAPSEASLSHTCTVRSICRHSVNFLVSRLICWRAMIIAFYFRGILCKLLFLFCCHDFSPLILTIKQLSPFGLQLTRPLPMSYPYTRFVAAAEKMRRRVRRGTKMEQMMVKLQAVMPGHGSQAGSSQPTGTHSGHDIKIQPPDMRAPVEHDDDDDDGIRPLTRTELFQLQSQAGK